MNDTYSVATQNSRAPVNTTMVNALTVDVEDYFQVSGFESTISRSSWDSYPQRVVPNTRKLLRIFSTYNVRATFYILGWTAKKHPCLVREIQQAGHQIGSHSYWHRLVYEMTPDEFRSDLRESKHVLEDIIGQEVIAYRAPSFSITKKSLWALQILVEEGFKFDSSVFPVYHDRYGLPGAPTDVHRIQTPSGELIEFPPSIVQRFGLNLPVSGGGYFRFYPQEWSMSWLSEINKSGRHFVFYIHPWEIDPHQPKIRSGSLATRFRHHLNLRRTESRLFELINRFSFSTVDQVVEFAEAERDIEKVRYVFNG